MADLRASLPPCFHTLFVPSSILLFSKPSHHNCNGIGNFSSNFLPSKRRTRFLVLSSKLDSDSSSSSSELGLLSTSECSDGSIVFRFGHARDSEAVVASVDVEKADNAASESLVNEHGKQLNESTGLDSNIEQVKSHSKRRGRRCSDEVGREVSVLDRENNEKFNASVELDSAVDKVTPRTKRRGRKSSAKLGEEATSVLGREFSEVEPVTDSLSELNASVEEAALDTSTSDPSFSESSRDEVSVNKDNDVVGSTNTGLEADVGQNEEIHMDMAENTTSISENGVIDVSDSRTFQASSKECTNVEVANLATSEEDNGNLIEVTNMSTMIQAETSLDQERQTTASDEDLEADKTKITMALGYNISSATSEEERASETNRSDVAGVSKSEVLEVRPIKASPSSEQASTTGFVLSHGAATLPHPSKGGEDAYFVAFQNWLGVANGVGLWSLEGSSSALYARELVDNCERIVAECKGIPVNGPEEVLIKSVAETQSLGSSTILVAYFDGQTFHVANIGDSGFIIIRDGAVFEQSSPMLYEFSFPVRIERGDDPSKLIEGYKIDLDEGDVIVTATDGLFDNLYEEEIASIVSKSLKTGFKPQDIAKILAKRAQEVGRSSSSKCPFADAAQAAGYVGYAGGMLDDVAVIVSLVQKRSIY